MGRIADVAREMPRLAAPVRDLADRLAERLFVPPGDDDPDPPGGERERDALADPLPSARHERDLAVESLHARGLLGAGCYPIAAALRGGMGGAAPRPDPTVVIARPLPRRYTPHVTRKKRVTRVLYGAFVAVVAAFTVSSIWQVARVVFGEPRTSADAARIAKVGDSCGKALDARFRAIEVAQATASREQDAETATKKYASMRSSWRETAAAEGRLEKEDQACGADPHGVEAVAALDRLDRAAEAHAVREARELSPVRLAAQSFISGPR
jgi:hypothetical protein